MKNYAIAILLICLAGTGIYFGLRGKPDTVSVAKTYNLDEYRKTNQDIILYKELAPVPTGFKTPTCIATGPDNRIYAGGDSQIRIFDAGGKELRQIILQATPTCIAVAGDSHVFVGFSTQVSVFNSDGIEIRSWNFDKGSIISGIAVTEKNVFIADAGKKLVHVKDLASPDKEGFNIGGANKETGDDGIIIYSPYLDVAVGENDLLSVVDPGRHRLKFYSQSGELISAWKSNPSAGIEGFSGCCNPAHIALCPDWRIVTSEKAIPRIKLYSPSGDFIGVVAGPESFKAEQPPCDIAVDRKGMVYAMDPGTGNIRMFKEKTVAE
ncbi:MAG: hypothetical protein WC637_19620 [Victivallales bacterium]|jgi:hypothetical protein